MSDVWLRINAQRDLRENIRSAIKAAGMTQRAAADAAQMKYTRLSTCLNNNAWIRQEEVEALGAALQVSAADLLGDSIYAGDPRSKDFSHRPDWYFEAHEQKYRKKLEAEIQKPRAHRLRRALCCVCGAMTRVNQAEIDLADRDDARLAQYDDPGILPGYSIENRLAGRRMWLAVCSTCGVATDHALLNDIPTHSGPDALEKYLPGPSADDNARVERDELVRRMEGFGVEVHWRPIGTKKFRRDHYVPAVSVEWDESKSVWRVEVNPEHTPTLQLGSLRGVWEVIALNKTEWWTEAGMHPGQRAVTGPNDRAFERAVDGLVEEIHSAAPAVLTSIVLAQNDADEPRA